MTIKVIDTTPSSKIVKQVICDNCGCTLEYVPVDIVERKYSCMGENCKDGYIQCPQCLNKISVKTFF